MLTSFILSQLTAFFINFFLLFSVILGGIGSPVTLENAATVGASILLVTGSFFLNHWIALSIAFLALSFGKPPLGRSTPASSARASISGSSN